VVYIVSALQAPLQSDELPPRKYAVVPEHVVAKLVEHEDSQSVADVSHW
jgi:hypothetical protein